MPKPFDEEGDYPLQQSELRFKGMIWDIVSETFEFGGQPLTRDIVDHPGAVAVVAVNDRAEILLIRQYRRPVNRHLWELPAGLLDVPGESKLDAAKRELLEETGYTAQNWSELQRFYTTPGGSREEITIFLAQVLSQVGSELVLTGEEAEIIHEWVPLQTAIDAVLANDLMSPSLVVGVLSAALKLELR